MRKLMTGLALAGATMAALPAAAQNNWDGGWRDGRGGNGDRGYGYGGYRGDSLRRASWMLDRAIQRCDLSRGEARRYRNELRDIYEL